MTELGTPGYALHPLHGIHEPTRSTPPRPDPVYLLGRGRDLITGHDRTATVHRAVGLTATVELLNRVVRDIQTDPPHPGLASLVGGPAMGGFRAAADAAMPELRQTRDLLYTLVDDVPGCTLISGHALGASGQVEAARTGFLPLVDQCAGFVSGGLMTTSFASGAAAICTPGSAGSCTAPPRAPTSTTCCAASPMLSR